MNPDTLEKIFVLHTRPYRNTSLIVEALSQTHGRIAFVAKSARGPKSRFRGQLQLFSPLLATWLGHNELKTLTKLEPDFPAIMLSGNCLACGFYLNELLLKTLQKEDPHPELFLAYQQTLQHLSQNNMQPLQLEKYLRWFEQRLLNELGYAVELNQDIAGKLIEPDQFYDYYPDEGFVLVAGERQDHAYAGQWIIAWRDILQADDDAVRVAKRFARRQIEHLLAGKTLRSKELL